MDKATSGEQLDFVLLDNNTPRMKVVKANALIEAHYELTVKEHKMLALAIARISKTQSELHEQVFSVMEIANLLGVTGKGIYAELDRISSGLMKKQVEIRHQESGSFEKYQWVTKAWCKGGNFGLRISNDLAPYLLGLVGEYTMYEVGRILPMNSHYSVRLYELLRQYGSFGSRTFSLDPKATKDKNWEDFSMVMGYDPKSYTRFSNLNQRILKPAMDQVRRFGEFKTLTVEKHRFGRKTIALRFSWVSADGFEALSGNPLYKDMLALGVKATVARDIFSRHGQDRIERNMILTRKAHAEQTIDNPAGYFVKAVGGDFAKAEGLFAVDDEGSDEPIITYPPSQQPAELANALPFTVSADDTNERHTDPVYAQCATDVEYQQVKTMERQRGSRFASYNAFHSHLMKSKFGTKA